MAYRPSPNEFPALLADVPWQERIKDRKTNAYVILLFSIGPILVSIAYAREDIMERALRGLWKPAIGIVLSGLLCALSIWMLRTRPCFVRRGDLIAVYKQGKRVDVISPASVTRIQLSILRTVKLSIASALMTLGTGVGLPLYLKYADEPTLVGVAWFSAGLLLGVAVGLDCIFGRSADVVEIGGEKHILDRPL